MVVVDVILAPALTQLPVKLCTLSTQNTSFLAFRRQVARYGTFSAAFNASGQPAASVPVFWTDEGVPVAAQVACRFGREDLVLQVSAQLENLAPWAERIAT